MSHEVARRSGTSPGWLYRVGVGDAGSGVFVGEFVGAGVFVGEFVGVGVLVDFGVALGVAVLVGWRVDVGARVLVGWRVNVTVTVGVAVFGFGEGVSLTSAAIRPFA